MTCKDCPNFCVFACAYHKRTFSLEELVVIADGGFLEWCKEEPEDLNEEI